LEDLQARLERLLTDAEDCALIGKLATDEKLMQSVKKGNVTLEGLRPVASRAFSELSRCKSA
jgi:hypothetical protein